MLGIPRQLAEGQRTNPRWRRFERALPILGLPGFIVTLDIVEGRAADFLLVPYFGDCFHQPPPSSQIVYATFGESVERWKGFTIPCG